MWREHLLQALRLLGGNVATMFEVGAPAAPGHLGAIRPVAIFGLPTPWRRKRWFTLPPTSYPIATSKKYQMIFCPDKQNSGRSSNSRAGLPPGATSLPMPPEGTRRLATRICDDMRIAMTIYGRCGLRRSSAKDRNVWARIDPTAGASLGHAR